MRKRKTSDTIQSSDDPQIQKDSTRNLASQTFQQASGWRSGAGVAALVLVLLIGAGLLALNLLELRNMQREQILILQQAASNAATAQLTRSAPLEPIDTRPTFMVWSPRVDMKHLQHVLRVFERLGYRQLPADNSSSAWDVLWAHDYPFHAWQGALRSLKPHQRVNHFPGTGYVTTKVSLATSGGKHIPPAFRVPADKDRLMEYAAEHPDKLFVQKSNDHRNIRLQSLPDLDLNSSDSFVQEFIHNPLLVDGFKFDIGVYTIVTSVNPLRIYKFDGDVLFRFCEEQYEPFNGSNARQYVIGEDYLPAWKVPSLKPYIEQLGHSTKEAFDAHLRSSGRDPENVWQQVDAAISAVYLAKEKQFSDLVARYPSKRSFFEMVRFDFLIDEDLKVHVLEANMSPNLSSAHYPPNGLMYEQVLFSMLGLVGVANYMHPPRQRTKAESDMVVAERNLMVLPEQCSTKRCRESCLDTDCQLCRSCLSPETLIDLKAAYREHLNRQRCKRVFPAAMTQQEAKEMREQPGLNAKNQLMLRWFQGKCMLDAAWCQ